MWQYGLPRTAFEITVARVDEKKAYKLLADLPKVMDNSVVTPAQRVWIVLGLSVILVVAIVRLVMVLIGG